MAPRKANTSITINVLDQASLKHAVTDSRVVSSLAQLLAGRHGAQIFEEALLNEQFYHRVLAVSEDVKDSKVNCASISAPDIMQRGAQHMLDRAVQRDMPAGERSMARCINAFNEMFGTDLTEVQGWQLMVLLKMSRSSANPDAVNLDDYEDGAAYFALAGEAAASAKV